MAEEDEEWGKVMKIDESKSISNQHVWYFKHLEENDYSIFTHDRKEILWSDDINDEFKLQPFQ